jgi:hypothetical protein
MVSTDAFRTGFIAIMHGLLFFILLVLIVLGRREYAAVSDFQNAEADLSNRADTYRMETVGVVSGEDIVEFILKNDIMYDYYICTSTGKEPLSTEEVAELSENGNASARGFIAITKGRYQRNHDLSMWSADYLIDSVLRTTVGNSFRVVPYADDDGVYAYSFLLMTEEEAEEYTK